MDYNNKDWYYSPQTYPFYAPYQMQMQAGLPMQMQGNYLKEMEYEKDLDRMRELYPNEVKKIQKYVDEECDRMEYEGSLMFDEYPDKTMLSLVSKRIMDKLSHTITIQSAPGEGTTIMLELDAYKSPILSKM